MALVIALVYFVALIIASTLYTKKKVKTAQDFTNAGQGLGWLLVTFSFVLVPLGSGHTLSLWETATGPIGASAVWWAVGAGCIFLPLMMLWLGPWVRETRLGTMPAILEKMFGRGLGGVHAAFQTMTWAGIGTAETIATGTAIFALSGGAIPFQPWCILIALALMLLYVFFGGVLQMAWLNVVNSIVLIIGSYGALIALTGWLAANLGGWEGVKQVYMAAGEIGKLSNFQMGNPDLWLQVIIPVVVLHTTAGAVSQCMNTTFFAAKDNHACRKGVFLGASINVMSCVPWVIMALVGMAVPAVVAVGGADIGKLVVPLLALETLPRPIVGLLMISLLAATLSTGGGIIMGNANVLASDIIKRPWKPDMSDKSFLRLLRIMMVVQALVCGVAALTVPVVFPVFLWCFSFGIPVFVIYFLGMVYKSSKLAGWITVVVTYVINIIWTFWTPAWATGPLSLNMYAVTISSVVLGVILTIILPGQPGLRTKKYAALHPEDAVSHS